MGRVRARVAAVLLPALALGAAGATVGACSGPSAPRPVASLASTRESGVAFAQIRDAWSDSPFGRAGTPGARVTYVDLRVLLTRFLATYPRDGLVPVVRSYLVFVLLELQDFTSAQAELAMLGQVRPGTASDLVTTARARWMRMHGRADAALEILRPLVGKPVDPIARLLFQEELVLTALANRVDYEAISYMDTWLRAGEEEEKDATRARVTQLIASMPREVLERSLQSMRARRAEIGYGADIEKILADHLAGIAIANGDAELARLLLDPNAGPITVSGDAGVTLGELATSRRGMNVVEGRTIGLLLPTESAVFRDESADVLRGVMWALGLPRGVRALLPTAPTEPETGTEPASPSGRKATRPSPCAPPAEASAPLDEPTADEAVRLVTRDDAGSAGRTEASLEELAGQGASVIVAALDGQTADRALRWGEQHHVTVITLATPLREVPKGFGFVAGESLGDVLSALTRDVPVLATTAVAPVVDASELSFFPQQGGPLGPMRLLPPVSCDSPTTQAGEARFPVAQWEKSGARGWIVTGSPGCVRDVVRDLAALRRPATVALTLEAATDLTPSAGVRVVSASAGILPLRDVGQDAELRHFAAAFGGRLSWWTALGRDAATLARFALRALPKDVATAAGEIERRRALARDTLAAARAPLWTTEARGLGSNHVLGRTVCTVDIGD